MDLVSALHELSNVNVSIYPNPASHIIHIDIDTNLNFHIHLYDSFSKLVLDKRNTKNISVADIRTGMYIITITNTESNRQIIERIFINN